MATRTSKASKGETYRCGECGWNTAKWVGRCGECQAWGTVEVAGAAKAGLTVTKSVTNPAKPITEIDVDLAAAWATGCEEFDRVLGGGIVSGGVILVAGEPGIGKSTLLLDIAHRAASNGRTALYVTGEESAAQVRMRAERMSALNPQLLLAAETDLGLILGQIEQADPGLLIVDSVQTISSDSVDGVAGNVTQVREVTASLIRAAKERHLATIVVGHVTKDGAIAGPRVLEHLVDVVCQFEGERHSRLRLVRAVKNRYGPTDEVGCFELNDQGITGLADPSGLFLSRHSEPVAGTCVTVTLEGRRPLTTEVQALVAPSVLPSPRRASSGVDSSRLAMVLAVVERRAGLRISGNDVYVSTVGGVKLSEPAADLPLALAIASAQWDRPVLAGLIAMGEVGLAGELRPTSGIERRLGEAARLGFKKAIVPSGSLKGSKPPAGMEVREAENIREAIGMGLSQAESKQS